MLKGKIFIEQQGSLRAIYEPPNEVLGWFLEQDVQSSKKTCDRLLITCKNILSQTIKNKTEVGNAHTVKISIDGVTIENQYSNSTKSCFITLDEFCNVINEWKKFISK